MKKNQKSVTRPIADIELDLKNAKDQLSNTQKRINRLTAEKNSHPDNGKVSFYKHKLLHWGYVFGVNGDTGEGYMYFPDGRIEQMPDNFSYPNWVRNFSYNLTQISRDELVGFPVAS